MTAETDHGPLKNALRRATTGSCHHADAFVERFAHIALRHVGGRTSDLRTTRRAGTSVRRITADSVEYEADDDPRRVLEVLGAPDSALDLSAGHAHLGDLMLALEAAARAVDPRITQVLVDAELSTQQIAMVGTEDVHHDQRSLLYLTIRVIAEENGKRATGFLTTGTSSPDLALDAAAAGRAAADRALISLAARPAPVAHLPVVVGPGRGHGPHPRGMLPPAGGRRGAARLGVRRPAEQAGRRHRSVYRGRSDTARLGWFLHGRRRRHEGRTHHAGRPRHAHVVPQ
jgi:TldD protein